MTDAFDARAPLPSPPEPWVSSSAPPIRSGPPYLMTEMIAAEPWLARRLLGRLLAGDPGVDDLARAIGDAALDGGGVVVTGCGTSEHAAQGVAAILGAALRSSNPNAGSAVRSEQAFELWLDPPARGLVIGVSHEGGTRATVEALRAARQRGARTALITAARGSPGAAVADAVLATGEMDQSWCHTVGYLSPLLAAAAVGARLADSALDADAVGELVAAGGRDAAAAESAAGGLAGTSHLVVVGSGADRSAGRELTLKIEEASWLPSAYRDVESLLHGHAPATDDSTGLVLLLTDREGRPARMARARQALAASRVLGVRTVAILAEGVATEIDPELTPTGRLVVPEAPSLPATVAALLGTATPLQLLTERLARARGTNPDLIRRDDDRYRRSAAAADA